MPARGARGWKSLLPFALVCGVLGFVASFVTAEHDDEKVAPPPRPAVAQPARVAVSREVPLPKGEVQVRAVGAESEAEAELPPPRYHQRPADEWQGMLIDLSAQAFCDVSERCGLARACVGGRCGPCTRDGDCGRGELCALDHCVPSPQVRCRSRHDCGAGELCTLSGYSSDLRGNAELLARCTPTSGQGLTPPATEQVRGVPAPRPEVVADDIVEHARRLAVEGRESAAR